MEIEYSEPGRRRLPHFAPLEFPNQSILQFVTVCVAQRRPLLAREDVATLLIDCWRRANHWALRDHARSHSFILRTRKVPVHTAEKVGSILAVRSESPLAAAWRKSALAARLL